MPVIIHMHALMYALLYYTHMFIVQCASPFSVCIAGCNPDSFSVARYFMKASAEGNYRTKYKSSQDGDSY